MSKDTENIPYIRIGCQYKRIVNKPLLTHGTTTELVDWSEKTIRQDHPENKNILNEIPKYIGTIVRPNHLNYRREIEGWYNEYHPIPFSPRKGECKHVMMCLEHIFEDQIEYGLDYLKLIYEDPLQPLPVLCLVSSERGTGKSTFLELLRTIFDLNVTVLTSSNFQSKFNNDWKGKLIIAVEEARLDKQDTETIKYLSTSRIIKNEAKGKDKVTIDFFAKFVFLSNFEEDFIYIAPGETRFWVRKIAPLEEDIVDLIDKIKREIPHFLDFLLNREYSSENKSRMWFEHKELETAALRKVISYNKNKLEIELVNIFITIMENFEDEEIKFQSNDLVNLLSKSSHRADLTKIRRIIKEKWQLKPAKNSLTYKKYTLLSDGSFASNSEKGRFYTVTKEWITQNFDELMK